MSKEDLVVSSRDAVVKSPYYKELKRLLLEAHKRRLGELGAAKDKDACWELSCENRGFSHALSIIERLELRDKEV